MLLMVYLSCSLAMPKMTIKTLSGLSVKLNTCALELDSHQWMLTTAV